MLASTESGTKLGFRLGPCGLAGMLKSGEIGDIREGCSFTVVSAVGSSLAVSAGAFVGVRQCRVNGHMAFPWG